MNILNFTQLYGLIYRLNIKGSKVNVLSFYTICVKQGSVTGEDWFVQCCTIHHIPHVLAVTCSSHATMLVQQGKHVDTKLSIIKNWINTLQRGQKIRSIIIPSFVHNHCIYTCTVQGWTSPLALYTAIYGVLMCVVIQEHSVK